MTDIERLRAICLALPGAYEREAWGEPTFRVGKRIFAMYADAGNHHGGGRAAAWCNAPLGVQELLVRSDPDTFFVPPYVGVKGWIGLILDAMTDSDLAELVLQSYCMVAPRRVLAELKGRPGAEG